MVSRSVEVTVMDVGDDAAGVNVYTNRCSLAFSFTSADTSLTGVFVLSSRVTVPVYVVLARRLSVALLISALVFRLSTVAVTVWTGVVWLVSVSVAVVMASLSSVSPDLEDTASFRKAKSSLLPPCRLTGLH